MIDAKRVLLLGGGGQLGSEILRRWKGEEIVAPTHAQLDLEDADGMARAFEAHRPHLVINCAAFHNVDACEREPERAFAANALAVARLARLCAGADATLVTVSTDYVFDGEATSPYLESAAPHPISVYGASKYAGELLTECAGCRAFIVRTCGVYGVRPSSTKGYTFIDRILDQAQRGETGRVVGDVIASPTFAGHLADGMLRLLATHAYGTYHVVNAGAVSWHDFAREALRAAGVAAKLEAIAASEWKMAARRPRFSALASEKLERLAIVLPDWREGIAAYLASR